jgi:hypothetical protein
MADVEVTFVDLRTGRDADHDPGDRYVLVVARAARAALAIDLS